MTAREQDQNRSTYYTVMKFNFVPSPSARSHRTEDHVRQNVRGAHLKERDTQSPLSPCRHSGTQQPIGRRASRRICSGIVSSTFRSVDARKATLGSHSGHSSAASAFTVPAELVRVRLFPQAALKREGDRAATLSESEYKFPQAPLPVCYRSDRAHQQPVNST